MKYVIYRRNLPEPCIPDVSVLVKENEKTLTVKPPELPGVGGSRRVDKEDVIAIISNRDTVTRAMVLCRMFSRQHRDVVKASKDMAVKNMEYIYGSLKSRQEEEERDVEQDTRSDGS